MLDVCNWFAIARLGQRGPLRGLVPSIRMKLIAAALVFLCFTGSQCVTCAADLSRGDDRLGLIAPPLQLQHWLNSPPLEMSNLRGNVALIRWWTDRCPFCVATAP